MVTIWNRVNTIILLLVLFALFAVIGMLATVVRGGPLDPPGPPASTDSVRLPGTPISGPTTITQSGHYYLTRNITVTGAQTAITISASGVTLDLEGFTIDGDDNAGSLGISISGAFGDFGNITVRDGVVSDFLIGLNVDAGLGVLVDDVAVFSNVVGMEVGLSSTVSDCIARNNTTGISLSGLGDSPSVIRDCLVAENSGIGMYAAHGGTIHGSDLHSNGTDLSPDAALDPNLVLIDTTYCSTSSPILFVSGLNVCP